MGMGRAVRGAGSSWANTREQDPPGQTPHPQTPALTPGSLRPPHGGARARANGQEGSEPGHQPQPSTPRGLREVPLCTCIPVPALRGLCQGAGSAALLAQPEEGSPCPPAPRDQPMAEPWGARCRPACSSTFRTARLQLLVPEAGSRGSRRRRAARSLPSHLAALLQGGSASRGGPSVALRWGVRAGAVRSELARSCCGLFTLRGGLSKPRLPCGTKRQPPLNPDTEGSPARISAAAPAQGTVPTAPLSRRGWQQREPLAPG